MPAGGFVDHRAEDSDQRRPLALESPPGDADHPVAGELEDRIALPVALECLPVTVEPVAVELDDELRAGPKRVDHEAADADVHRWLGQALFDTQAEESPLELVVCVVARRVPVPYELGEPAEPRVSGAPGQQVVDLPSGEKLEPIRVLEGMGELGGVGGGQVEEGSGDRGDRDAGANGAIGGGQAGGGVDDDRPAAAPAARAWNRDLDRTAGSDEAPKRRGRAMAEQGSGAKREDRRHPMTTLGQQGVADGVDATVKQVETAPCEASLDGALVEAELVQLGPTAS